MRSLLLTILGLSALFSFGQDIQTNTKYFTISFHNQAPPDDISAHIDTLTINSQLGADIKFSLNSLSSRQKVFHKYENKIFLMGSNDSTLMYDFNLNVTDTFKFQNDEYILDSVKSVKLDNDSIYRHWYLNPSSSNNQPIVWVEGLGEKSLGWDYSFKNTLHLGATVKAICIKDSLIYWFNGIKLKMVNPSCNFAYLKQLVSIKTAVKNEITIYPNPSSGFITLTNLSNWEGAYLKVYSVAGKRIVTKTISKRDIKIYLEPGIYVLQVAQNINRIFSSTIIVY